MINRFLLTFLLLCFAMPAWAGEEESKSIDEKINEFVEPISKFSNDVIFVASGTLIGQENPEGLWGAPVVLILLAVTALFLTLYFGFINFRAFGLAIKTVKGKYSKPDDPGQITHFQALTTALSATVGLGNIAGVAVAIGLGGPGAVFWMVVMGVLGMTSKFVECTLGVKYRSIDEKGKVLGGGMRYLEKGLGERGFGPVGKILAIFFAVACIGGAIGAGNMFQVNQSAQQVSETFGIFKESSWIFGAILAVLAGAVIIGGIVAIARVTAFLVPFMTIIYVLACLVVLIANFSDIPAALGTIVSDAFTGKAAAGGAAGGFIVALLQGIKRGVFSNEAGLGSAAIAHAPVKTRKPASEGVVALLEPFIDTVIVCLMTALVVVTTGTWKADASVGEKAFIYDSAGPEAGAMKTSGLGTDALVKVLEKWSLVELVEGGAKGYLGSSMVTEDEEDEGKMIIGQDTALLRSSLANAEMVQELKKGQEVTVVEEWAKIRVKSTEVIGFMPSEHLVDRTGWGGGIWLTSQSFKAVIPWFPYVLTVAVVLFAFSTMISWSFYGEQAVSYLTGGNERAIFIYKIFFCVCAVVGAGASLQAVLNLSDAMYFAMVFPNLIGLYFLLPVVKNELAKFQVFAKKVDAGASIEEADAE